MYDGLDHSPRKEVKAPGEEEVTKFDDGQSSQIKDTGNVSKFKI